MTTGTNRPGRKDQQRRERPDDGGPARLRVLLAAALALAATAFAAMPAQAATGGASAFTPGVSSADEEFVFSRMRVAGATWYGPGLYGNGTACGRTLRPSTMGVAHRSLPCGTPVKFVHRGRAVVTTVIDRGPYVAGIRWDLTNGVRRALGFEGAGQIRYAIAHQAGTAIESRRRRSGRGAG
jgi:rare lipoprotein A (peptidoglycan hydrolase)